MKRVLIITGIFEPDIGGPASYAKMLASHIGSPATVLTYSSVWSRRGDKKLPFKVIRTFKRVPGFIRHTLFAFRVFFHGRRHDILLVLSTLNGGIPAVFAQRMFKKRLIVRIPGDVVWQRAVERGETPLLIDDFQKEPKRGWLGMLWRMQAWVARNADAVLTQSEYQKRLVAGWGVSLDHIRVVYNGVALPPPHVGEKQELRKRLGVSGNLIISAGRLVPWKGFRMLIKLMPRLLSVNQFFRLVVVGDGYERKALAAMVKNLGLERKVYLVGAQPREKLWEYLGAGDIFVLNTGYEGFSHQLLEAMAAGIPVVTTNAGGNRELIRQGENGFMVRYNDEFNLKEAMVTLWTQQELREHFIAEGFKTVEQFTPERMVQETMKVLDVHSELISLRNS